MKKQHIFQAVKSYVFIALGLFINALGWTAFLIPSKIVGGGVAGIGTIMFFWTGFPVGFTALIINSILVLVAMKILGARFGINTIFGIATGAVMFVVLQMLITEPFVNDTFMAALIGGALAGAGIGIAFVNGGNSGGTDIVALLINKYRNISPGRIILYLDLIIIASGYFVFRDVEKIVYGYVVMAVQAYVIDLALEGARQSYQIMIISDKYYAIADRISSDLGRGVTSFHGKGWYNKKDREILMVFVRKHDKQKVMRIIKEIDDKAFLSVAKVAGVFGLNFEELKI